MNNQTKAQLLEKVEQQHRIIMELQAENERLKAELEHGKRLANKLLDEKEALEASLAKPDRLQSVLDMLDKVSEKHHWGYYLKINTSETGEVRSWDNHEIFEFDSIEELIEKSKEYLQK